MRNARRMLTPLCTAGSRIMSAMVLSWTIVSWTIPPRAVAQETSAQETSEGPSNEKAQKTFRQAQGYLHDRMRGAALEEFKKADKQDDGHCVACQKKMIKYGIEFRDWKTAETGAEEMVTEAHPGTGTALAHYELGLVLMREGEDKHKDEVYTRAHDELTKAVAAVANFPGAIYADGLVLAHLKQDDAAKARFELFVTMKPADDPDRQRALRYIAEPELARARMAPPFAITTLDGQHISMDDLKGKVVLIDFWATWCAPCRAALPHMREIAKKFEGQPLVVLSVSLDKDEQKWKEFIGKNGMTWSQCRIGGFDGDVAKLFGVEAIPHTFTIDADGVLQDEHIGDASVEGKLKKLVARAQALQEKAQAR
jgi:thiol-disulfide isomerase/thioredoxin